MSSICGISPEACSIQPTVCSGSGVVVAKDAVLTCAHVIPDDFQNFAVFFPGVSGVKTIGIRGVVLSGDRPVNYRKDLCKEVLALIFLAEDVPSHAGVVELAAQTTTLPVAATFRRMNIEQIGKVWTETPEVACQLHDAKTVSGSCPQSLITRQSLALTRSNGSSGGGYFANDRLISIHVGAASVAEIGFVSMRVELSWLNTYLRRNHA
jgi:hypothetical protein